MQISRSSYRMFFVLSVVLFVLVAIIAIGCREQDADITPNQLLLDVPSLQFIDAQTNTPLSNQIVQMVCYETQQAVSDNAPSLYIEFTTDTNGEPVEVLPSQCRHVAALQVLYEQPSTRPERELAYTVYAKGWQEDSPPTVELIDEEPQTIFIYKDEPLVLFDVAASLAWEPTDPYVDNFVLGLSEASQFLFEVTNGRMAFGPVKVDAGGDNWIGADIRVSAANDLRPSATVGGIATETITNSITITPTQYSPGEIYVGRNWQRNGEPINDPNMYPWHENDGYRTLIHEWAHYGLFLYDEYMSLDGTLTHCLGPGQPESIMYWQYNREGLLSDPEPVQNGECEKTIHVSLYGMNDCDTLEEWHAIQDDMTNVPSATLPILSCSNSATAVDSTVVDAIFGQEACQWDGVEGACPTLSPIVPTAPEPLGNDSKGVNYDECGGGTPLTQPVNQIYHVQYRQLASGDTVARQVIPQGRSIYTDTNDSLITILGTAVQEDAFVVQAEQYGNREGGNDGRCYSHEEGDATQIFVMPTLGVNLDLEYESNEMSHITSLTAHLSKPESNPFSEQYSVTFQLCNPDAAIQCPDEWVKQMSWTTDTISATFTPSTSVLNGYFDNRLPPYGIVYVRIEDGGKLVTELIRWYRRTGVGPGGNNAHTPSGTNFDDEFILNAKNPLNQEGIVGCDQVVISPAANFDLLTQPFPEINGAPVQGLLSWPMDVAVRLPGAGNSCPSTFGLENEQVQQADDIVVTIQYDPTPIGGQIPILPNQLSVLYFDTTQENPDGWTSLRLAEIPNYEAVVDPDKVEVESPIDTPTFLTVPYMGDGIYVIGYTLPQQ